MFFGVFFAFSDSPIVLENAGGLRQPFKFLDLLCSLYCFKTKVFKKEAPVLGEADFRAVSSFLVVKGVGIN